MKVLVYLKEEDDYCFEDVVTAFNEDKKELLKYVKRTIKNNCGLRFDYETEWDSFRMYMGVGFFNEIDMALVEFLTEQEASLAVFFVLDTEELK